MTTVINNPGNGEGSSGVAGLLTGVIIVILFLVLFFLYGLPMIRNSNAPAQESPENNSLDINVTLPEGDSPQE